jgi:hypothetical protein
LTVRMSIPSKFLGLTIFATLLASAPGCHAFAYPTEPPAANASSLPDSPGAVVAGSAGFSSSNIGSESPAFDGQLGLGSSSNPEPTALPRVKFVYAGKTAPPQTTTDKIILGLRESVTPFTMVGWVFSAGWAQLIDGSPNYGTNGKAFSQRLGAAAALSASKEIFSDSVLAPVFHQDPRYYQLGRSHKFFNRAIYAGTRTIIGRTDSGKMIPNYATILGTGGAAGLTTAYYPARNTTGSQVVQTWATSLGGSALGYLVSEFGGEIIQKLHITKQE